MGFSFPRKSRKYRPVQQDPPPAVPSADKVTKDGFEPGQSTPSTPNELNKITAQDLPDLQRGIIELAQVDELFADIAAEARLLQVIPKWASRTVVQADKVTLEEARELLADGRVNAIQVRYLHGQREWRDKLTRSPEGIQIVRIEHPLSP
jgi:hypothetical protein